MFLNVLFFNVWFLKDEKWKIKWEQKAPGPFYLLEVMWAGGVEPATRGGRYTSSCQPLFSSVPRSSNQHRPLEFGRQVLLCLPWLLRTLCKLLWEHGCSCLSPGCEGGGGTAATVQSWNCLKLITICHPGLPLEVARLLRTPEFLSNFINLRQCKMMCRWKDRLWCFLPCHLPVILSDGHFYCSWFLAITHKAA